MLLPSKLQSKLKKRIDNTSLRSLHQKNNLIDFSSNDYLGYASNEELFFKTHQFLLDRNLKINGATGSRLLTGNHELYTETESLLATFYKTESALVFNSGYDANIGFFSCVPQRDDIILYDEFVHASIRDGIQLSNAKAFKFKHNNIEHLEELLLKFSSKKTTIYVVTESVFSMDGDSPDLIEISNITTKHKALLIIDEAHAVGVFGNGLIPKLQLEATVFARIITFGKAFGCHGAAVLGSRALIKYLINFARSFIYTTGLSPHSIATILQTHLYYIESNTQKLHSNIHFFNKEIKRIDIASLFIQSNSAIHCCIISGNEKTKKVANKLHEKNFDVKPILSPTVSPGKERLRFCLHSYNSEQEITNVLENLSIFAH